MTSKREGMRTLVQLIAAGFFLLQLVFAVQKYVSKPTMISEGSGTVSDLGKPLTITVCQDNQYNQTQAKNA